jgi:hypothetical protein
MKEWSRVTKQILLEALLLWGCSQGRSKTLDVGWPTGSRRTDRKFKSIAARRKQAVYLPA